jgi:hypothetical protein
MPVWLERAPIEARYRGSHPGHHDSCKERRGHHLRISGSGLIASPLGQVRSA